MAGAGVAGVAAALAAARRGIETCLVEKTVFPGGLATSGCILHSLPLSDSRGNPKSERRFSGVDGKDVSEFVLKGRMGMARA